MKKTLFFLSFFVAVSGFSPIFAQDEEEQEEQTDETEKKDSKKKNKKDKEEKTETTGEEGPKQPESDCPESENADAVKLLKKYQDKKKYEYKERVAFLKQCLEEDPEYVQANFEYARQIILVSKNHDQSYKSAMPYLLKVVNTCPKLHSDPYYYLGILYWEDKNYNDCIKYMTLFLNFKEEDEKKYNKDYTLFLVDAKKLIQLSKLYDKMFNHPVPFDPQIVQGLSSGTSEYLPIISPDGTIALFTRQKQPTSFSPIVSDKMVEVFMISKYKNGKWDDGFKMTDPFNKGTNEGGATLTIDNKHMYLTICTPSGNAMDCNIWTSDLVYGSWTPLVKLNDNVNRNDSWESQPSIASDGSTIYFTSDRPGGYGGTDIWKTVKDATGVWGPPINLGPKINTGGNEKSPFIHSDSQTLYFSSGPNELTGANGLPGVGGYDIFFSKADSAGNWQTAENIGYPINTKNDDLGLFVSSDGHYAYFSSDDAVKTKNKTLGGYDIYSFELYKEARPQSTTFTDISYKSPADTTVQNIKIKVVDAVTKKETYATMDTANYTARVAIVDNGHDMFLKIEGDSGVAFSSQLISADSVEPGKILKTELVSKPIEVGAVYLLNNIYYKTGYADLDPKSKIVLEEFAEFLKKNPNVKIEIRGHTDNVGDDNANMNLSKDRAYTVFETLIALGVNKDQILSFKGLGETQPIDTNDTESGRSKNRRTEFVVIEK